MNPTPPSATTSSAATLRPAIDPIGENELARIVMAIAESARDAGGRALVVGGAVRDAVIAHRDGRPVVGKDIDLEVFGLEPATVAELVGRHGPVDTTGEHFAVFKLHGHDLDVALPRTEEKSGSGHRGFLVNADPFLPPERAALRRDFTVNAISWDPLDSSIVDPLNGRGDLDAGILRHVGPAFGEDPLRVLRAAQFIARFELDAASETVTMCRTLLHEAETLPRERVAEEWTKLLLQGTRPGSGLHFLDSCGWIERTPGLAALRGVEQDPVWHPEGDVFVHTAHVMDAWARIRPDDREDALVTGLAALCHDLGKPSTTEFIDGRWRARGHESAGTAPTGDLLGLITIRKDLVDQVVPLVENHLAPVVFHRRPRAGRPAIRRLANRVGGRLDRLVTVAHADQAGRPPLVVDTFEAGEWLLAAARDLGIERSTVDPLVQGRDLIELGLRPGRSFGAILAEVYEAQLDDAVADHTEAVALAVSIARRDGLLGNTDTTTGTDAEVDAIDVKVEVDQSFEPGLGRRDERSRR